MRPIILLRALAFCIALFSTSIKAELQTWRFTGDVVRTSYSDTFTPPGFPNIGESLIIDYQFDTSVDITPFGFTNPVKNVSFNNETSKVGSYFINQDGFYAINVSIDGRRDGIDFMSWNLFGQVRSTDSFSDFLNSYQNTNQLSRLNNRNDSFYLLPKSFSQISTVPEPRLFTMILAGLGFIGLLKHNKTKQT